MELAREYLDVANHFDPAAERGANDGLAQRNARTRKDRVHAFQERCVECSKRNADAGVLRAQRSQGRRRRSRIGSTHARATRREPTNTRKPRVAQAENQDFLALPFMVHLAWFWFGGFKLSAASEWKGRRGPASS